jgi:hypothetical protein
VYENLNLCKSNRKASMDLLELREFTDRELTEVIEVACICEPDNLPPFAYSP